MSNQEDGFSALTQTVRDFAARRQWEPFHTPKNLAMAIAGEAGELSAEFQWMTPTECRPDALSDEKREAIALEIADVQIYLLRLADVLGLDMPTVVRHKISINESRFPVEP